MEPAGEGKVSEYERDTMVGEKRQGGNREGRSGRDRIKRGGRGTEEQDGRTDTPERAVMVPVGAAHSLASSNPSSRRTPRSDLSAGSEPSPLCFRASYGSPVPWE